MSKILIVDDDPTLRKTVHVLLKRNKYIVIEAESGKDALMKLEAHPDIVLIVTDLNMPEMNGLEFIEALPFRLSIDTKMQVMMLSTESGPEFIAKAKALGVYAWTTKPFKPIQLLETILIGIRKQNP